MASRSVTRASRIRNPPVADVGVQPNGQNPLQDEQEVSQNRGVEVVAVALLDFLLCPDSLLVLPEDDFAC